MKTTKYEIIETPIAINVTEARLLTKEEAEALPERLRLYADWWWTFNADADDPNSAWLVNGYSGDLYINYVDWGHAVRPALIFESKDLKIGDKFYFEKKEFEVIKEGLAFCLGAIGKSAFRTNWKAEEANNYEKSGIKKYIDNWFKEAIK